jgi:hypothetical protein
MTLDELRARLVDHDPEVRAYFLGKVLRQAKPDDVFTFVSAQRIADDWQRVDKYLGKARPFWAWLLGEWHRLGYVGR